MRLSLAFSGGGIAVEDLDAEDGVFHKLFCHANITIDK